MFLGIFFVFFVWQARNDLRFRGVSPGALPVLGMVRACVRFFLPFPYFFVVSLLPVAAASSLISGALMVWLRLFVVRAFFCVSEKSFAWLAFCLSCHFSVFPSSSSGVYAAIRLFQDWLFLLVTSPGLPSAVAQWSCLSALFVPRFRS